MGRPVAGREDAGGVPFFYLAPEAGRGPVAGPTVLLGVSLAERVTLRGEPPGELLHRQVDGTGQFGTGGTGAQVRKPPIDHRDHTCHAETAFVALRPNPRTCDGHQVITPVALD